VARPRKKAAPRKTNPISTHKKYIFATFFVFLGILTLIVEPNTKLHDLMEI